MLTIMEFKRIKLDPLRSTLYDEPSTHAFLAKHTELPAFVFELYYVYGILDFPRIELTQEVLDRRYAVKKGKYSIVEWMKAYAGVKSLDVVPSLFRHKPSVERLCLMNPFTSSENAQKRVLDLFKARQLMFDSFHQCGSIIISCLCDPKSLFIALEKTPCELSVRDNQVTVSHHLQEFKTPKQRQRMSNLLKACLKLPVDHPRGMRMFEHEKRVLWNHGTDFYGDNTQEALFQHCIRDYSQSSKSKFGAFCKQQPVESQQFIDNAYDGFTLDFIAIAIIKSTLKYHNRFELRFDYMVKELLDSSSLNRAERTRDLCDMYHVDLKLFVKRRKE